MSIFNLGDHFRDIVDHFVIKYSMGYTRQKNREQYVWWDYEELSSGRSPNLEEWNISFAAEPSLMGILNEAETRRRKAIHEDAKQQYGLPPDLAAKMIKTYIGYSPAYGGYICQLGPYLSERPIHEAIGKFSFYVFRKRNATPESINKAIAKKINKFTENYGTLVDFDPSDFSYDLKMQNQDDPESMRQKRPPLRHFDSLDPNNPNVKEFFENPPIEGTASKLYLNAKGRIKILRAYLGPWYEKTLNEMMQLQNKTEDEIVSEIMKNPKVLKTVYARARLLWDMARAAGDPAALAIGNPPDYKDSSLSGTSGAQIPTGPGKPKIELITDEQGNVIGQKVLKPASRTTLLISSYKQKKEILEALADLRGNPVQPGVPGGAAVDEAQAIADRLNQSPNRIEENRKVEAIRRRLIKKIEKLNVRQAAGEDVSGQIIVLTEQLRKQRDTLWTKEDVESWLNEMETEHLQDPTAAVASIAETMTGLDDSSGYDDLLTAFSMAKMYFSAHSVDGETGAKIGASNSIIFNPPENFNNYTSKDLQPFLDAKAQNEPPPVATKEEIQTDIGDIESEPEKLQPEEVPGTEGEVVPGAPVKTPEELEQEKEQKLKELEDLLGHTLNNLIKIAEDLDKDGKFDAAEEVHKVIRKYEEKI